MNKFNVIVALSIVAAAALFGGAIVTPALAQENMPMTKDNPLNANGSMGNMTMSMDNSTDMGNGTVTVN